jgi:hypothetical protein
LSQNHRRATCKLFAKSQKFSKVNIKIKKELIIKKITSQSIPLMANLSLVRFPFKRKVMPPPYRRERKNEINVGVKLKILLVA